MLETEIKKDKTFNPLRELCLNAFTQAYVLGAIGSGEDAAIDISEIQEMFNIWWENEGLG